MRYSNLISIEEKLRLSQLAYDRRKRLQNDLKNYTNRFIMNKKLRLQNCSLNDRIFLTEQRKKMIEFLEKNDSENYNKKSLINKKSDLIYQPISPDKTICPISLEIINENELYKMCSICMNCFNRNYLNTWLDINTNCPTCRQLWYNNNIYINTN